MSSFLGVLFAAVFLMALIWLVCVTNLSHQLRDRHPEKYEELGLARLWPQDLAGWVDGHNNAKPVFALLRFLLGREDVALQDAAISSLSTFLRWLFYIYLGVFGLLLYSMMRQIEQAPAGDPRKAVEVSSQVDHRRARAFEMHRAHKFAQAIAVYDELLRESERDAELSYWRGMAHWHAGHADQALADFRRVIELEPTNFSAHHSADRILSRQRRWDEVLEIWNGYILHVPGDAEAYYERGGTNFHKGDLAAARADATSACGLGKTEACAMLERLKGR